MNWNAIFALALVAAVGAAGVILLRSIDRNQVRPAVTTAEEQPAMTADEAAAILPAPREGSVVVDSPPPPPPPPFEGPPPVQLPLINPTLPPQPRYQGK